MEVGVTALALGAVVGLILALAGAGGGILAVPLLVFGLHLTIAQAAPVGLIAVGLASALGALLGLREGSVRYRAAAMVGVAGMLAAPLGVRLAGLVPNAPLTIAFSILLAGVAWRMVVESRRHPTRSVGPGAGTTRRNTPCVLDPAEGRLIWTLPCARVLTATGVLSGVLSGLLGVGGGFVIVPALTRYTDIAPRSILATSLAVIALVSAGGVAAASAHGAIPWSVAGPFAAGAVVALLGGRLIASCVAGARLQQAFAVTCAAVAAGLLAKGLQGLLA